MTIIQLEYIVAVDKYGGFSKAAEKCFVTQPTLSMQIQKLEAELGIAIFDRAKKPIIATALGRKIIDEARDNLKGISHIKELVFEEADLIRGELQIGIIPTITPYLLPRFVFQFTKKYPLVNLVIEERITEEIVLGLQQDKFDAGIVVTPLDEPGIKETPLFYETFLTYLSPGHPLNDKAEIDINDLDIKQMLLLSSGHCFREQVVNICPDILKENQFSRLKLESGSLETLMQLVDAGYGYTLIPELAANQLNAAQKKHVKPLKSPQPVREVSLISNRLILKKNLLNALKEEIINSLPVYIKNNNQSHLVKWKNSKQE